MTKKRKKRAQEKAQETVIGAIIHSFTHPGIPQKH